MRKQSGFTLIELMVVMAIIAILATAGLSAYTGYVKKGRDTARIGIANQVNTAVNALMASNNGIPPTAEQLIAELATMNMTAAMDVLEVGNPRYLSSVSPILEGIKSVAGIPSLLAEIREPSGGRPVCLGYDALGEITRGESCAFRYIVYGDNTYVIGYGVEHESSLQKNFYHIQAPITAPGATTPAAAPLFLQVIGTAGYVGLPSIGEDGGPAPDDTPVFTDSQISVVSGGATVTINSPSEIVEESSAQLSTETSSGGGGTVDACNNACTGGQVCDGVDTCVNVCDGSACLVGQVCGVNDTCVDLCGGIECQVGEVCEADACVVPDPCPIKTPGQQCTSGAIYAGSYGGYDYMTTPSDLGTYTWGPSGITNATSSTDGAGNTATLVGLVPSYPAAEGCYNLGDYGFEDWFLPAHLELTNVLVANKTSIGGLTTTGSYPATYYWSSTEKSSSPTLYARPALLHLAVSQNQDAAKTDAYKVRCLRKY